MFRIGGKNVIDCEKSRLLPRGGAICSAVVVFNSAREGWLLDTGGEGQWAGMMCVPHTLHSSSQRRFNDLKKRGIIEKE